MSKKMKWFVAVMLVTGAQAGAVRAELIAHYPFDEGQGTAVSDVTGNGNDGTFSGAVEWVPGHTGTAVRLDTAGERVVINALDPTAKNNAMTLTAWIRWEGEDHGSITHQGIFGKRQGWDPRTNVKWFWEAQPDGDLAFRNGDTAVTASGVLDAYSNEWVHVAMTWENDAVVQYINAVEVVTGSIGFRATADATVMSIGCVSATNNETFVGSLDEARIYDHALAADEIHGTMIGEFPRASNPDPDDGAVHEVTWVTFSWTPGTFAVSHDLYLSDNFDDVNDGAEAAFQGNRPDATLIAGFSGFPIPDGLVPGTTYYWRVDEVNDADPNSPWKGDVWSFWVPPTSAYAPSPSDGALYVDRDLTLTWEPGFGAKLHNIVFGDSFDDVNSAPAGSPVADTTFAPSALEADKTYYWRVDELNPPATVKGDVWSFTTLPDLPITDPNLVAWYKFEAGAGTRIIDFSGHGNHGEIINNILWGPGQFNLGLEFLGDNEGHVEMPAGLVTTASGSVMMWVNTDLTDDEGMFWYGTETGGDGFGGENEVHIHVDDPGVLGFGMEGATDVRLGGPQLAGAGWNHVAATWDQADGCRLYFNGAEVDFQVYTGNVADLAVIRLGRPVATGNGNRYYDGLMDDVRLFDRAISAAQVNEIMSKGEDPRRAGSPGPANGSVAPINLATTLTWSAGEGASQHDVYFGMDQAAVAGADVSATTGVYVGRQNSTSYTPDGITLDSGPFYWRIDEVAGDGTIVEGGLWSFTVADYVLIDDFETYNDIPAGEPGSDLVYLTWADGFDNPSANGSTMGYVTGVSLETGNVHSGSRSVPFAYNNAAAGVSEVLRNFAPAQDWTAHGVITLSLWFAGDAANVPGQLYVKVNGVRVNYDGDAGNLARGAWQVWNIDLTAIGTNLTSVRSLAIGIQGSAAIGTLLLDDIRLYTKARELITPVLPDPAGLIAYFPFDGNANDAVGGNNGVATGNPQYAPGKVGQAISLDGLGAFVDTLKTPSELGIGANAPRTVTVWVFTRGFNNGGIFTCGNYSDAQNFCLRTMDSDNNWRVQYWGGANDADFSYTALDRWVHFTHVHDGTNTKIYADGRLVVDVPRTLRTADDVTFRIGDYNSGQFNGLIDEFRLYNRALTEAEAAGAAGITQPYDKRL